ncbi:protein Spindly-A-like isoform X2 [Tubulanus polymorphus]|uniref:protein Spindly-A-like isoform X2 n=1 Tax=Tubulanus polymorphus TaxID=672921 RepID=UPI003DA2FF47
MEDTEKIKLLEAELEEKSDEVIKVAQIGKTLLEANGTLQNQLEEMRLTNIKQIEELEQEKFSLNKKLEAKFAMEVNYLEEIENLKSSLTKQKEKSEELLQIELSGKLTEIRNKFENSRAEVERLTLIEKQLKTELEQVNLSFKSLQEKNQQQENISNETFSEEMVKLHSDLSTAYQIKADLEHEIQQINNRNQQLSMNKQHLEEKVERLKGTIEEKDCTIVSYQNTIEKTQEEMIDLQIQLDAAQMEQTDLKKKGNSLFSEVEDRRLNVEKEFINLRVENESVTQQLKMSQQQMHQLKLQMFGMLDMAESKVDRTHLHWLEKQLSRSREEVEQLTNKLQHIEKQTTGRTDDMVNFHQAFSNNSKSDSYYMDFMKAKLKSKENGEYKEGITQ